MFRIYRLEPVLTVFSYVLAYTCCKAESKSATADELLLTASLKCLQPALWRKQIWLHRWFVPVMTTCQRGEKYVGTLSLHLRRKTHLITQLIRTFQLRDSPAMYLNYGLCRRREKTVLFTVSLKIGFRWKMQSERQRKRNSMFNNTFVSLFIVLMIKHFAGKHIGVHHTILAIGNSTTAFFLFSCSCLSVEQEHTVARQPPTKGDVAPCLFCQFRVGSNPTNRRIKTANSR